MKMIRCRLAILLVLLAAGCGGGSSPSSPTAPTTPTPTRVIGLSGTLVFGNVEVGQSATKTLTITNTGDSTLTVTGLAVPIGTAYTANWTSGTIAAGASQSVTITFAPTAIRIDSGSLTVSGDQTSGTNTIAISGSGVAVTTPTTPSTPTRIISLSGDLTFGSVQTGQTPTTTMTVTNSGNAALTITSTSYPSGFTGNFANGTIAAGASQSVTVMFIPTTAQAYSGTITFTGDQTSGTNTIAVSGTGVGTPTPPPSPTRIISLSGNLAFGSVAVGSTATRTLTIANSGTSTLTWTGISTGSAALTANPTSGAVAAGGSQAVTLAFAPTAVQSYNGTVTVTGDQTSGTNTTTVSGSGTAASPSPTRIINLTGNLSFGSVAVGASANATFAISNTGDSLLTIGSVSYPMDTSGDFSNGTIAPGGSRVVTVSFRPTALQTYSNVLTLTSDATSGLGAIGMSGTGAAPPAPSAFAKLSPTYGEYVSTLDLSLTWQASTGASSYEYCYRGSSDPCTQWITNGASKSASLSGLQNGVTYYWYVRAVNSTGVTYADYSATAFSTFTTADGVFDHGGGPNQVTLNVAVGANQAGSFGLRWTQNMAGFTVTSNVPWLHVACVAPDITLSNGCRTTSSGSYIRQIDYDAKLSCSVRYGVITVSLGGAVLTATFGQGTCEPDGLPPSLASTPSRAWSERDSAASRNPQRIAYADESFNDRFCDECFSLEWLRNRTDATIVIEQWRRDYNHIRPQMSLGYLTPWPSSKRMRQQPTQAPFSNDRLVRRTQAGHSPQSPHL